MTIFQSVVNSGRLDVLLPLLQCPACRGEVATAYGWLVCRSCDSRYPVTAGIPRFASPGGEHSTGAFIRLLHGLAAQPWLYDRLQDAAGGRAVRARVRRRLGDVRGATVLDIGAGTGALAQELPRDATYLWLDHDPAKLDGFLKRRNGVAGVLADATRMPLRDAAVDYAVCVNVAHHLDDVELGQLLIEARRAAGNVVVLVDAIATPRLRSRLLWRYDRGAKPRTLSHLVDAVRAVFDMVAVERFRIHHEYVLIEGRPR
jgi:SAM-dependent methyltransferase